MINYKQYYIIGIICFAIITIATIGNIFYIIKQDVSLFVILQQIFFSIFYAATALLFVYLKRQLPSETLKDSNQLELETEFIESSKSLRGLALSKNLKKYIKK